MAAEPLRILLVDDEESSFELTRAMLSRIDRVEVRLDWVASFEEALDELHRDRHDVYLVDYMLADMDGLELVREAREMGVRKPIIMLTGKGSHQVDVEAMRAGASDYLVKGKVDPDQLERTVRYALERWRAEEALRDSEERHRGMFDHLPIGLYRSTPAGEFMDANPALVRILGYPDPRTLKEAYSAQLYVSPADQRRFRETLDRYGVARGFETRLQRPDGTTVVVRNTARAHRAPDGQILYIEGAVEDVTEMDRASLVQESAARFRTIFESSGLAILLVDLHGVVMEANPAFRRSFGYGTDGPAGRPVADLVVAEERTGVVDEQRSLADGARRRISTERRFLGGDGGVLWARCLSTLVTDSDGEPDHVMILLEDVAEVAEGVTTP